MSPIRVIALSIVVAVSLAGCVVGSPEPTTSETVAEPSSTPTAEPTKPELSELVLTADGLGPLQLAAAPPVTSPELDILVFDEDFCAGEPVDDPGLWVTNYPDVSDGFYGNAGRPFSVGIQDGLVTRIDVGSAGIATAEGIRVGSSLDDVLAAYPDGFDSTVEGASSDAYVVDGAAGRLLIEVTSDDRIDGYWAANEVDRVIFISAWGLDLEPRPKAGSDNTVGNCTVV